VSTTLVLNARKVAGSAASIFLIAGSVVLSLAVLEFGCRLMTMGPSSLLQWPNLARQLMSDTDSEGDGNGGGGCRYRHDATLGWSLPPNCASADFNVGADGFRRTPVLAPGASPPAGPPVLATGSSFTVGIEVADGETWPAWLQDRMGRRVVNAGVSGYSLDQTVLDTERLAPLVRPQLIVVGFTPGDIWRTELRVAYSREKPAFVVNGAHLELANVPIPPRSRPSLPVAARWLGWSALAHEVVERLGIRDGWYYEEDRASPPGTGETISCLLMPRLATLGVPVVVVAQYGRGYWQADAAYKARADGATHKVLGCAEKAELPTLDLAPPLAAAIEARGLATLFRSEHHSAEGNRVVADLILRELVRARLLPASGRAE
jgi:hypothetical protein